jgi:muconolactone delta-isomerase
MDGKGTGQSQLWDKEGRWSNVSIFHIDKVVSDSCIL